MYRLIFKYILQNIQGCLVLLLPLFLGIVNKIQFIDLSEIADTEGLREDPYHWTELPSLNKDYLLLMVGGTLYELWCSSPLPYFIYTVISRV